MAERRRRSPVRRGVRGVVLSSLTVALLAGCQAERPADPPADGSGSAAAPLAEAAPVTDPLSFDAEETCGAEKLGRWLNALLTDTVKAEIGQAIGHDRIRYIAPEDAVTLDYRPDRLNVETGADGRIKLFRCG